MRPLLLAAVLIATLTSGCLGSSSAHSPDAAVAPTSGIVVGLVAAQRAVSRLGRDGLAELHPVPAARVRVTGCTAAGARLVRRLRTDAHGDFRLRLPPGRYVVAAQVAPVVPRLRQRVVVIRPGQVTTVWIAGYLTTFLV